MATLSSQKVHKENGKTQYISQMWVFSINEAVDLGANMTGGYVMSCWLKASADDIITISMTTAEGVVLINHTTTGAIVGEFASIGDRYTVNSLPTVTVSGLGSGTLNVEVVISKQ